MTIQVAYPISSKRKRCSPGQKKGSKKGEPLKCIGLPKRRKPNKSCKHGRKSSGYCMRASKK